MLEKIYVYDLQRINYDGVKYASVKWKYETSFPKITHVCWRKHANKNLFVHGV